MTLRRKDKIGWDEFGALVQQLVEGVLSVGRRLTKQDSACGDVDKVSTSSYGLAVGFHRELLKICGKTVHVLIKGRY